MAVLCTYAGVAQEAQEAHEAHPLPSRPRWDKDILNLFATLPVQDEGRVKPLDTVAQFRLLRLNGKRECLSPSGERLTPMEWLLDAMFYPEIAESYKTFVVPSWDALDAVGLAHEGKNKRDRYSYVELFPARNALFKQAREVAHKEEKDRSGTEQQIVNLAMNMRDFELITHFLDFARMPVAIPPDSGLAALFPAQESVRFSALLEKAPAVFELLKALQSNGQDIEPAKRDADLNAIKHVLGHLDTLGSRADGFAIFPPEVSREEQPAWTAPSDLSEQVFHAKQPIAADLRRLQELENVVRLRDDRIAFRNAAATFRADIVAKATERGEYRQIPLEVFYYKAQLLYWSLVTLVLGFIIAAISWLWPRNRVLSWATMATVVSALTLLTAVIVIRCIIRGRPPVTTLYETILFTTAVGVLLAVIAELIIRQKIAISLAALFGSLGLFLAYKFEAQQGVDTMPNLVAVLDTNFWLATHVTTVTIGYSAGLLAAAISHIYLFGNALNLRRGDKAFYKSLSRMTYGVICFGLLFATVGTVLGGIWANYSWGRFWGWDPKENGALMIVLWQLAILHARMGGYIRDFGLHMASVFCGMIVVFSWFGVNLLGVGLHSYGFTSGIVTALLIFYGVETFVLLVGVVAWIRMRVLPGPPAVRQAKAG